MRYDPRDPTWVGRDRFVLSCGHASMLLYSMLHLSGYDLPLSQIERFRQWDSKTPGHPEHGVTPGVETTTGPLGQGIGNAVGMALAVKMKQARFGEPYAQSRIFCIASDGDLMEGVSAEASSIAGHLQLDNLLRHLRRQPHHHRGRHGAHVLGRRLQALRVLRLVRAVAR